VDLHRVHSAEHSVVLRSERVPGEIVAHRRPIASTQVRRDKVAADDAAEGHGFRRRTPTVGQHHVLEVIRRLTPGALFSEIVAISTGRRAGRTKDALCEDSRRDGRRRAVTDEPDAAAVRIDVGATLGREIAGTRPGG